MNVGIDENTILDWMRFQLEIFLKHSWTIIFHTHKLFLNVLLAHVSRNELQPCE